MAKAASAWTQAENLRQKLVETRVELNKAEKAEDMQQFELKARALPLTFSRCLACLQIDSVFYFYF